MTGDLKNWFSSIVFLYFLRVLHGKMAKKRNEAEYKDKNWKGIVDLVRSKEKMGVGRVGMEPNQLLR